MSILVGSQSNYLLFRSINKYSSLTSKDKVTIQYTERYHGLRYEKGYVDYSLLDDILRSHLADVDMIQSMHLKNYNDYPFTTMVTTTRLNGGKMCFTIVQDFNV
ncbi:unnamed protein product [Acanthoscelides obtectus]|uniref:Uncharacterized protein n=1 Tax=Acanthoscelides obtectus TaxID=200917 RepID=A0A9P0Q7X9_ACAOB|nr:unnamed protein product [Acanthoscelides obtectus]CAK1632279.1 hypothetical protein AOBTE_LOCUS7458 [Acanthoscelides obtectus]